MINESLIIVTFLKLIVRMPSIPSPTFNLSDTYTRQEKLLSSDARYEDDTTTNT